jgi:hypothetical protein
MSIDKLGVSCSNYGSIWYNYFWFRSNYAAKCDEPVVNPNRYYYEHWVSRYLRREKSVKSNGEYTVLIRMIRVAYNEYLIQLLIKLIKLIRSSI